MYKKLEEIIKAKTRLDFLKLNLQKLDSFEQLLEKQSHSYGDREGLCLEFKYLGRDSYFIEGDTGKLNTTRLDNTKDRSVELLLDTMNIKGLRNTIISNIKGEIINEIKSLKDYLKDYEDIKI